MYSYFSGDRFVYPELDFSESVWEHMAQMCVKTRRLDVALVCLGNMGHARGARALRKAMKSGAPQEVQVAILAIQLGLIVSSALLVPGLYIEEARSLFASCGRYDLVNRLLQSHNQWNSNSKLTIVGNRCRRNLIQAFEVAEHNDRIHLRNTYYAYAKYLESLGANEGAIENYEKSDTQRFEVPRMLFDDPKVLETYVKKRRDPNLQRWWAQYLESIGDLDGARGFYYASKDYLSVVRLFCYNGCIKEACSSATEVANTTADKAACYHLGRYFENEGDMNSAVHFFTKAHAYSSAIRLARDHGMKDKLANLALMAGGSDLVEAARYYEDIPGQADKAVMLYHKVRR
ncbi:unnamed protein product [Toxocara canis]|uniref:IF140/IFT172/WDR19 TPR domain-containing protein n=1 Tax=Toxocara canis TaxID=6265 RepID=A0A3P7GM33_TOXCA|nr:unnamed protein product [Toxocara canis]